jgi:tripartite-type tricarboxylate transporter receptor subunit TctC
MTYLKKLLILLLWPLSLWAAEPITIVVPFPAGGPTDLIGRYISKELIDSGIPTVVINKVGAGGIVGMRYVADARRDSTLITVTAGSAMYAPLATAPAPYDIRKDFEPITMIGRESFVIAVPSSSPFYSTQQLINELRRNPGKLNYAWGSSILRYSALMFLNKVNATANDIPYNGSNPVALALMSNQVDFAFVAYSNVKPGADDGRIRILGIADKVKHPAEPNIKTFQEQGIDFVHNSWTALMAPKGMDPVLVDKLNRIVTAAIKRDTKVDFLGLQPWTSSPAELKTIIDQEFRAWQPVIVQNLDKVKN